MLGRSQLAWLGLLLVAWSTASCGAFRPLSPREASPPPRTLEQALDRLDANLQPEVKLRVRCVREGDLALFHMGLGLAIRNGWGLWGDSALAQWFKARDVRHPDDMSAIILHSYWRRLHGYPIDLAGQVRYYQAWWACSEARRAGRPCPALPQREERPRKLDGITCPSRIVDPPLPLAEPERGARSEAASSRPRSEDEDLPPFTRNGVKRRWLGIHFVSAVHEGRLDALNEEVRRQGYSPLPVNYPALGLGMEGGEKRFRFNWDLMMWGHRTHTRLSDGEKFAFEFSGMGVGAGYDLFQHEGFSVHPSLGLGMHWADLEVDPNRASLFHETLREHPGVDSIWFLSWQGSATMGVEQLLPLWRANGEDVGLSLGLRIGRYQRLGRGSWSAAPEGPDLGEDPDVFRNGLRVRLSVGLVSFPLRWPFTSRRR